MASLSVSLATLLLLCGCISAREDFSQVAAGMEQRTGHTLTNGKPGEVILAAPVRLEDGLTEDEAVTLALWNNAAFQETLTDLNLSRGDLVQAGMLPNPTFSMLFPVGAKPLELTAKYPLEIFWLRPGRVAAAKLDYERTAQRLVQSGLDLIRDVRLAWADLGLAAQRRALAESMVTLDQDIAQQAEARLRSGEASELEAANTRVDVWQAQEQWARAQRDGCRQGGA